MHNANGGRSAVRQRAAHGRSAERAQRGRLHVRPPQPPSWLTLLWLHISAPLSHCLACRRLMMMTPISDRWCLCRHVCEQAKPCVAVAPAPQPAVAPVQAPVVSFLECPAGMSQVSCYLACQCAASWDGSMRLYPAAHHETCCPHKRCPCACASHHRECLAHRN